MPEREALRAQTTDLLNRLRSSGTPHELFQLLEVLARRLDRIELGSFDGQDETPTKPERRVSSATVAAVRLSEKPLGERTKDIFDAVKDPRREGE
jgi:hypothetical protein